MNQTFNVRKASSDSGNIKVPEIATLDLSHSRERGLPEILKMDIEGGRNRALRGAIIAYRRSGQRSYRQCMMDC